ncbi:MAG TPA: flagellar basal body P-ring formation chaperone FlgA [Bryobacteraceae bacterium]|nr:flagellar basal body P-ring formation chaperone FlgA [Bryobacteraceae bacterium]
MAFALACLAVPPGSDHILAADLASAFPPLAAVPPATEIAIAPAPGVARVFRAPDLRLLAARFHLDAAPAADAPICVERPVAPLDAPRLLAAMRKSLPDARIEILEFSRQPAPSGEIEFPAAGLHPASAGAPGSQAATALWNGAVLYAGTRRFAIWATVTVRVTVPRVLAVADLRPGQPIAAAQLAVETRQEFPSAAPFALSAGEVAGRWPRLAIRAGSQIRTDQLEQPREVMRGSTVRVDVRNGAARLELDAVAEASGGVGEFIPIRNPSSGKRFRARVEAPGRVSVDVAQNSAGAKP